ncbi:MAG TPA: hypothetical protein VIG64_02415 [Actinomycetota bacterium]|jgi:hypothetical protein
MDQETLVFIEGMAAVISAIIVFCGSVWLLLMLVMGGKLAYFVTASVTLGVLLIMGVVWSTSELGPVGELPSWSAVGVGKELTDVDFGEAAAYPDAPWVEPDPDDAGAAEKKGELESSAPDALEGAIEDGTITTLQSAGDALVDANATRLLEQGGTTFGAVVFTAAPTEEEEEPSDEPVAFAVLERDPGNPLGPPRQITGVILILFVLHVFGLGRIEKRAKASAQEAT